MVKYNNLHEKIKHTRETLGLKQKDFIAKVAEKLGEKPKTPGLVSQWESGRTTPKPEHIAAIAKLTPTPWWYMLWFMHDALPADRGVNYEKDGSFSLAPNYSDDEIDEMQKEIEKHLNEPPMPHLVEWMEAPEKLNDLRLLMAQNDRLHNTRTPVHHEVETNERIEASANVSVPLTGVAAAATVGQPSLLSDQPVEIKNALLARRGLCVGDLLEFKEKTTLLSEEGHRLRGMGERGSHDERVSRHEKFQGALRYHLEEDCGIGDADLGINKSIISGAIRVRVSFFLYGVSVQLIPLNRDVPLGMLVMRLRTELAQLVLVDRMQNRAAKKMLLFYTHENGINMLPMHEQLGDYVQSAAMLGVTVEFASGPNQTAYKIAELIASLKDPT